jgi:CBS domain-containing protein
MTVGAICNRDVIVTGRGTSAAEAAQLMREFHVGDLVVIDEAGPERLPIGVVTDRDLVIEVMAQGVDPHGVTVESLMTRSLETVREDTEFWDALSHLRACGVRRMPVVNARGGLEGIFTFDDALGLIAEALVDLGKVVPRQIAREQRERPRR